MDTASPTATPETVSASLRTILHGLLAVLGGWGLDAARAVILYRRIGEVAWRIEQMLRRFRAGKLWRVIGRVGRQSLRDCTEIEIDEGAIHKTNCTLPKRYGWLVKAGGHQAAGFGSQLQHLLAAPEMAELLAAAPQAVRLLRPLCRALAVELPCSPATSGASRETTIRSRTPRPKPEPLRIPLPRGVLMAARRAGFGKLC